MKAATISLTFLLVSTCFAQGPKVGGLNPPPLGRTVAIRPYTPQDISVRLEPFVEVFQPKFDTVQAFQPLAGYPELPSTGADSEQSRIRLQSMSEHVAAELAQLQKAKSQLLFLRDVGTAIAELEKKRVAIDKALSGLSDEAASLSVLSASLEHEQDKLSSLGSIIANGASPEETRRLQSEFMSQAHLVSDLRSRLFSQRTAHATRYTGCIRERLAEMQLQAQSLTELTSLIAQTLDVNAKLVRITAALQTQEKYLAQNSEDLKVVDVVIHFDASTGGGPAH
jgi:hypothetical protein